MAVFTAIATAIVGAFATAGTIFGSVMLFNVAVGVVATGLAVGTAKLFGVFEPPSMNSKDPGVKIQLAPSTDNKVPRFYGRNFTGGIIVDAEIKDQNKTMAYCLVISEYNAGDTWTVSDVYRGDGRLTFSGATVQSVIDPNSTASNKISGKMRCRVYAGGSTAAHQIFPATGAVNAYGGTDTGKTGQFKNWTAANTMEDLVFAVFEVDYEPEEGLTGLGAITFDINNSVNNPSEVLQDYLLNDRYGANLSASDLDTAGFADWETFCDELVAYTPAGGGSATHKRYQIDGALSTFTTAKNNIDKICLSGGGFFTYNGKTGKFDVVANRAATVAEQANAFVLTDDNIVSSITITSTELFSLYNEIEVEYPSVNRKDQTDVYFANVDVSLLNPNEPTNTLSYRLDMCNDRARVSNLANIDLNQNRLNKIVECTTDFTGMQMDVGDVVKLTSDLYGFNEKLFRVMRLTEIEDQEGMITVKTILLEYDDDVYGDLITAEDLPQDGPGISNWWVLNSNASINLGNITVVNDPTAANANIHNPATGAVIGTVPLANVRNDFGSTYSGGTFINVPIDVPANTTFSEARVVCINETATTAAPVTFRQGPGNANVSYFEPGSTFNFPIDTFTFDRNTQFRMDVSLGDDISGSQSLRYITGTFQMNIANVVTKPDIAPGGAGILLTEANLDVARISNLDAQAGNVVGLIEHEYTITNTMVGKYSLIRTGRPTGVLDTISSYDTALAGTTYVVGPVDGANIAVGFESVGDPWQIWNANISPEFNDWIVFTPAMNLADPDISANVWSAFRTPTPAGNSDFTDAIPSNEILSEEFHIVKQLVGGELLINISGKNTTEYDPATNPNRGFGSIYYEAKQINKGEQPIANSAVYPNTFFATGTPGTPA